MPVALRALQALKLRQDVHVDLVRDEADRRNGIIQHTVVGALAVERLGDIIARAKELPR